MKFRHRIDLKTFLFGAGLSALGCGDEGATKSTSHTYPLDAVLRFNDVQAKGTHNSYHVALPDFTSGPWAYTHDALVEQLERQGVRQLEIDVHEDESGALSVQHVAYFDPGTNCVRLRDCLAPIAAWSRAHPAHHPLTVLIEPKVSSDPENAARFWPRLEAELLEHFAPGEIITPALVRGESPTLREAILSRGFPPLSALRGRTAFVITGSPPMRAVYAEKPIEQRLLFAFSRPEDDDAAFLELENPIRDQAQIRARVAEGFVVRTRADVDGVEARRGDRARFTAALESGAQLISTDFPEPEGGMDYAVEIPGGTPSRCNPITAPADCSALDIENPAYLGR